MLRVVLADQHRQVLWALRTVLQEETGLEIIGEAVNMEGLFGLVTETNADVVMLDKKLLGRRVKETISRLHTLKSRPIVIVMSTDFEDGRTMLQAGADAFVSKGDQPNCLLQTLRLYKSHASNPSELERGFGTDPL